MLGNYKLVRRPWRARAPLWYSMVFELLGTIACLVLFSLQQPNLYRTLFWRIGFEHHLNSNPDMVLYAMANHRPPPRIPFVWSQTLTEFNVAISVLSLFALIAKMATVVMHVFFPIVGLVYGLVLTAMYVTSMVGQIGPDHADARYPSNVAWYLSKGCDLAKPYHAVKYCHMAKGTFALTVLMFCIYLFCLGLAVWSMLPNKALDVEKDDLEDDWYAMKKTTLQSQQQHPPQSPLMVPFTPRTQTFRTLDNQPTTYHTEGRFA